MEREDSGSASIWVGELRLTSALPAAAPAGPPLQPSGPSRLVRSTSRAGPSGSATPGRYPQFQEQMG